MVNKGFWGSVLFLAIIIILTGTESVLAQSTQGDIFTSVSVEGVIGSGEVLTEANEDQSPYNRYRQEGETFTGFRRIPRITPVKITFKQKLKGLEDRILLFILDMERNMLASSEAKFESICKTNPEDIVFLKDIVKTYANNNIEKSCTQKWIELCSKVVF